jgi:hypothetical protein
MLAVECFPGLWGLRVMGERAQNGEISNWIWYDSVFICVNLWLNIRLLLGRAVSVHG